jgi:predicted DNA binding CopG/RHH family protein
MTQALRIKHCMTERKGVRRMTKKKSRIPEFKSLEEEAHWWETHNLADYQDEFKTVKAKFAKDLYEKDEKPQSKGVTVRLDTETIDKLHTQAKKKGLGTTTLIRMLLLEHLEEQEKKEEQEREHNQYPVTP